MITSATIAEKRRWHIDCVVGARPNFVKIAPVLRALRAQHDNAVRLIHTGQHYDVAMNEVFFDELAIPKPDITLDVGPGTPASQIARIMLGLEHELAKCRPDILLLVGDVNSTLAAALTGSKMTIPLAHVEAGLRSYDRSMPEESNRIVTDQLSDLLFTTERDAEANLMREGIAADRIRFVGNVMIDTLYACLRNAVPARATMERYGASPSFLHAARDGFGFVTLHRPSNVDDSAVLKGLLQAFGDMARDLPLVFALHPRTQGSVAANGFQELLASPRILVTPPLSYLRTLGMMRDATLAITDSGGIQEETTALGVPCLTVRANTERPVTVAEGTNILVGTSPDSLRRHFGETLALGKKRGRIPDLWDGKAAERIAGHLRTFLSERSGPPHVEGL
jgi:UDP-N-acetylglucosamine 2-epimerase (non-hydrolysing)